MITEISFVNYTENVRFPELNGVKGTEQIQWKDFHLSDLNENPLKKTLYWILINFAGSFWNWFKFCHISGNSLYN